MPTGRGRQLWRNHHTIYITVIAIELAALIVGFTGGFVGHDHVVGLVGQHGSLEPPVQAESPLGMVGTPQNRHFGYLPTPHRVIPFQGYGLTLLPSAVDFSRFNPPVGDQKTVNSCTSWVVGYYMRAWYAARDGSYPRGGFAPMYLYSQVTHGHDVGSTFPDNFQVLSSQGVDTHADYKQGDYNYWAGPTRSERVHAKHYKVEGWSTLFNGQNQGYRAQQAIEAAIANGNPVALGLPVYENFYNAGPRSYYIDGAFGQELGGHAVFASKYDANGVWIENQWGTSWGLNGWVELSWGFIERYVIEANILHVALPPAPHPPIHPMPSPVHHPRAHPTPPPVHHPRPRPKAHPARHVPRVSYQLLVAMRLRPGPRLRPASRTVIPRGSLVDDVRGETPHWKKVRWHKHTGWLWRTNLRKSRH